MVIFMFTWRHGLTKANSLPLKYEYVYTYSHIYINILYLVVTKTLHKFLIFSSPGPMVEPCFFILMNSDIAI